MARIPLVRLTPGAGDAAAPSRAVRLVMRQMRRKFGSEADSLAAMAHHPGVLWTWGMFETGVQRQRSVLPAHLRDLVVFVTAVEIGCSWCVDFGASIWERKGLDPAPLREAVDWRSSEAFDADQRAAFAFAAAMTAQPPRVDDAMVADLRRRFGDAGVVEIAFLVGLENLRSRFNTALGLSSQGFSSGEACSLAIAAAQRRAPAGRSPRP